MKHAPFPVRSTCHLLGYHYCFCYLLLSVSILLSVNGENRVFGFEKELLQRAASVRNKLATNVPCTNYEDLFYPSAYLLQSNRQQTSSSPSAVPMRGFCNWIIPNHVMLGQYPGQTPERSGPSKECAQRHIESMIHDAGIRLFCSLQSETPSQTDYDAWTKQGNNGVVYLPVQYRQEFPFPFTHYAPIVETALASSTSTLLSRNKRIPTDCKFLQEQIVDLSVPNPKSLESLLTKLLVALDKENRPIYIHCWGGRGRAGIVGSCLISLIWPELDATMILDHIQAGYQSRLGHDTMPHALARSPQTESQRQFVRTFVKERQSIYKKIHL